MPGAKEKFFGCHGAYQTPICSDIAWSFHDADGRSLPTMASRSGVPADELADVFLGAFSAGGKVVRRLLLDPRDRARIRAVLLSDATYASWRDKAARIPLVQDQLVRFGAELSSGTSGQLFVATASPSPNGSMPTGVEVLQQLRKEIEEATGLSFERIESFYGIDPAPDNAYKLGDVIFAEYPMEPLGHKHTDIAPQLWQRILHPWLEAGSRPLPEPVPEPLPEPGPAAEKPLESLDTHWLVFGLSALASYAAFRWFSSGRRFG